MSLINFSSFPNGTTLAATDANWQNVGAGTALTGDTVQSAALQPANWANDAALYVGASTSSKGTLVIAAGSTFVAGQGATIRANANTAGTVGYECRLSATQAEVYRNGVWFAAQTVALGAIAADTSFTFENAVGVLTLLMNGGAFATFTTDGTPLTGGYAGFSLYDNGTLASMRAVSFDDGNIVQQVAYPAADDIDSSWAPSTGVDLYAVLDDESDADWITTTDPTTSGRVLFPALQTPQAGTQTLSVRTSGSAAKKLTATLIELVAGNPVPRGTFDIDPLPLTPTTYTFSPSGIVSYSTLALGLSIWPATSVPTPSVVYGTTGAGASGTTSCTPSYPTGINAATSELICIVTGRSNTANTVPTMPAGWTWIGGLEGGTGTWGVDTGTRRVDFFKKDTVAGTETGTVTVSLAGTTINTLRATIVRVEKNSGYTLDAAISTGADTTNATSYSATGSTALSWAANDLLLIAVAQCIDTGTQTAQAITASGVTFGTRTNRASTAVTNGNDHRHIVDSVPVTTGSGSSAPTYSYTISAAGSGPTGFLRLRSVPPTELCRVYSAKFTIPAAAPSGSTYNVNAAEAASLSESLSTGGAQAVSLTETVTLNNSQSAPTGGSNLTNQDALSHPPPTSGPYAYDTYRPGAGGFPAVGATYADPVFNATVLRLTNMTGQNYLSDIYAHHWANCNGTLAFHQDNSGLQIINTTTGATVYSNQPVGDVGYDIAWDMVDPNLYYFYSGASLMVRNLSAGTSSVKKTFPATLGPLGGSLNMQTADGRYFLVFYSNAGHIWDSQIDLIYTGSIPYDIGATNGWITITPSGKYCVTPSDGAAGTDGNGVYNQFKHWSYALDHVNHTIGAGVMFWGECGDHGVVVSASDNNDYFVTHSCFGGAATVCACTVNVDRSTIPSGTGLGTPGTKTLAAVGWDNVDGHMSGVSKGIYQDWAFIDSEDFTDNVGAMPTWSAYKQEIFAVNVVTEEVRRFCHHRSRNLSADYRNQPRISCSADGSITLWCSNYGILTPVSYTDMYAIASPLASSGSGGTYSNSAAESFTLSDAPASAAASSVSQAEALVAADSSSGPVLLLGAEAEGITLNAAQVGGLQVPGTRQEALTLAEVEVVAAGMPSSVVETIVTGSVGSSSYATGGDVSESAALANSQSGLHQSPGTSTESASLADSLSGGLQTPASVVEGSSLSSDQDFSGAGQSVSLTETAAFSESAGSGVGLTAASSEVMALTVIQSSSNGLASVLSEAITLSEASNGAVGLIASALETVTLSNIVSSAANLLAMSSEALTLTDTSVGNETSVASILEGLVLVDQTQHLGGGTSVSGAEAMSLDTASSVSGVLVGAIAEAINTSSVGSALVTLMASMQEGAVFTETVSTGGQIASSVTEGIGLASGQDMSVGLVSSITEPLSLNDSRSALSGVAATILESLVLLEAAGSSTAQTVVAVEALGLNEQSSGGAIYQTLITEVVSLSDLLLWLSSVFSDPKFVAHLGRRDFTASTVVRVMVAQTSDRNFIASWRKK